MSSAGTKVTKDPQAQNDPKVEGAGTITSDSLAGESLSQGGSFGAGSHVAASKQPSASTTTNNTDTSGATKLDPAPDAEARQASEEWSESAQLNAGKGLGKSAGVGPTYNIDSGGGKPYNTTTGSGSNVGVAPNYVNTPANRVGGSARPHGANISEGGFDSGAPNASFNQDIGGKNDPGRVALNEFQRKDAESGADAGGGPRQAGVTNDGQYSALGGDTSA
ncbi:hypothetical protein M8818_002420 [Zalaria obscura]|uniref:Uncharacterized protein n=1 Tax=Zalaria obscura TaxID=2024903 RepID=A0ACC3SHQ9_9PEZI